MPWIITLIYLGIAYYTIKVGIAEWKKRNKFASVNIMVLAMALILLSIWIEIFRMGKIVFIQFAS